MGIHVDCAVTQANQPIGSAMGPALEAREALEALCNPANAPKDLIDKATTLAGLLFRMVGKGDKKTALKILNSGKAEKKLRDIIRAQGGNPDIKPSQIPVEKKTFQAKIVSKEQGTVYYMSNKTLINIAKMAGAPKDIYAGILLNKKLGDRVRKNETLYTIYAEKKPKLKCALSAAKENNGYNVSQKKILIEEVDGFIKSKRN